MAHLRLADAGLVTVKQGGHIQAVGFLRIALHGVGQKPAQETQQRSSAKTHSA